MLESLKTSVPTSLNSLIGGYVHPSYAESLVEFGSPRPLHRCHGWLLQRRIPASDFEDAMGCYPIFACLDWSQLHADLDDLNEELVSVTLVTDPFGEYGADYLRLCFPNLVIPFKQHFVVDLSQRPVDFVDGHHQRNARKALKNVWVEHCPDASRHVEEWSSLYAALIERRKIRGLTAFSKQSFAKQLAVPGITIFRAVSGNDTVGMTLWYDNGAVGYYHLGAYSPAGYELGASFALFWRSLEHFARAGLRWLNLGAGAGLSADGVDGLSRFKRGWSTGTRTAYLCGRILDQARYAEIVRDKAIANTSYFPAYRAGEFS